MAEQKDRWDKLKASSTLIGSVVVGLLTLYVNSSFKAREAAASAEQRKKDDQLARIKALSDFMPHLSGTGAEREAALFAISALGWPDLTLRLAGLRPDVATSSAAVDGTMRGAPATLPPTVAVATPAPAGPSETAPLGWVYLGDWTGTEWRTRYLDFDPKASPSSIAGKVVEVRRSTGQLNVRRGLPTPEGEFPSVVAVLQPGQRLRVGSVQAWQSTGYQWAPATLER
jgi:hypothetical protein